MSEKTVDTHTDALLDTWYSVMPRQYKEPLPRQVARIARNVLSLGLVIPRLDAEAEIQAVARVGSTDTVDVPWTLRVDRENARDLIGVLARVPGRTSHVTQEQWVQAHLLDALEKDSSSDRLAFHLRKNEDKKDVAAEIAEQLESSPTNLPISEYLNALDWIADPGKKESMIIAWQLAPGEIETVDTTLAAVKNTHQEGQVGLLRQVEMWKKDRMEILSQYARLFLPTTHFFAHEKLSLHSQIIDEVETAQKEKGSLPHTEILQFATTRLAEYLTHDEHAEFALTVRHFIENCADRSPELVARAIVREKMTGADVEPQLLQHALRYAILQNVSVPLAEGPVLDELLEKATKSLMVFGSDDVRGNPAKRDQLREEPALTTLAEMWDKLDAFVGYSYYKTDEYEKLSEMVSDWAEENELQIDDGEKLMPAIIRGVLQYVTARASLGHLLRSHEDKGVLPEPGRKAEWDADQSIHEIGRAVASEWHAHTSRLVTEEVRTQYEQKIDRIDSVFKNGEAVSRAWKDSIRRIMYGRSVDMYYLAKALGDLPIEKSSGMPEHFVRVKVMRELAREAGWKEEMDVPTDDASFAQRMAEKRITADRLGERRLISERGTRLRTLIATKL